LRRRRNQNPNDAHFQDRPRRRPNAIHRIPRKAWSCPVLPLLEGLRGQQGRSRPDSNPSASAPRCRGERGRRCCCVVAGVVAERELHPATTGAVNVAFDDEIGVGHPVFNSGEMGLKRREPQQSVNNTNKQLLVSHACSHSRNCSALFSSFVNFNDFIENNRETRLARLARVSSQTPRN
jgi:hypothetical protein